MQVSGRHLALPLQGYVSRDSFAKSNDAWIGAARELGTNAPPPYRFQNGLYLVTVP